MTGQKKLSELHPDLSWGAKYLLDYIHAHTPTLAEVRAGSTETNYANRVLLTQLKRAGLIHHKQKRTEIGDRLGESRYYVTELALASTVPAGTEE